MHEVTLTASRPTTLVIGYGNPGRLDDGLGPAAAEVLAAMNLPGVTVESNYQLNVEDAADAAAYDQVIFVDAAVEGREPFDCYRIEGQWTERFTTHSVEPQAVLALAQELFAAPIKGYVVAIRGYEFDEFGETLSAGAQANLALAVKFLQNFVSHAGDDTSASRDVERCDA